MRSNHASIIAAAMAMAAAMGDAGAVMARTTESMRSLNRLLPSSAPTRPPRSARKDRRTVKAGRAANVARMQRGH